MLITKTSILTGETHTLDLPITQDNLDRYANGELIQYAFPGCTPEQREFLVSGITPDEWHKIFPDWDEPLGEDVMAGIRGDDRC